MIPGDQKSLRVAWPRVWTLAARHRELGLAAVFVAMAGWELIEFVVPLPSPGWPSIR